MVTGSRDAQDADEGFTEEEGKRGHGLEGKAPPLGLPAHFALEGTAEHSIVSFTALALAAAPHTVTCMTDVLGTWGLLTMSAGADLQAF